MGSWSTGNLNLPSSKTGQDYTILGNAKESTKQSLSEAEA